MYKQIMDHSQIHTIVQQHGHVIGIPLLGENSDDVGPIPSGNSPLGWPSICLSCFSCCSLCNSFTWRSWRRFCSSRIFFGERERGRERGWGKERERDNSNKRTTFTNTRASYLQKRHPQLPSDTWKPYLQICHFLFAPVLLVFLSPCPVYEAHRLCPWMELDVKT